MGQTPTTMILQIGELDKGKNSYPLRLFVAGKKKELALDWITADELDRTKLQFGDPVTTFLTEVDPLPVFQTIGNYLYTLLYRGTVKEQWDKLSAKPEGVRIELEIIPKDVAAFPWELLNDGLAQLALPGSRFTRKYTPAKAKKPLPPEGGPLRVLVVIGAKDEDTDVSAVSEVRNIETEIRKRDRHQAENLLAHRMIDIKVVSRPTILTLQTEYQNFKPDIFHFIGHGELIGNDGCLVINVFDDNTKKYAPVKWTAAQIFANFQAWGWLPRLVFINACRSDTKNTPTEDIRAQAWSIGDVFRRLGVPAVLSMQADIKGDLAGTFAGIVYKGLAELKPLDEAVGFARGQIMTKVTLSSPQWAVPVLTLAVPPEEVLGLNPNTRFKQLPAIKACDDFETIDYFSDRADIRRTLIQGFYPLPPEKPDKDLIIVKGGDEVGKSWLAKWCMEVCALLNHDIRYVEIGGAETQTWLDILLQIRDGDPNKKNSLIHQPLSASAFYRFNWELEHRFKGEKPPTEFDNRVVAAKKIKLGDPNAKWAPNFEVETFESFQRAIIQAAEINNPLIIVLDHFTKGAGIVDTDMPNWLIPNLVVPAATQKFREQVSAIEMRSVKFVLILTEKEFNTFKFDDLVKSYHLVPVTPVKLCDVKDVALEYMRYLNPDFTEEGRRQFVDALGPYFNRKQEWTPKGVVSLIPR
jgi:CHAT domain-containing protein